jgi:hypothetical protein
MKQCHFTLYPKEQEQKKKKKKPQTVSSLLSHNLISPLSLSLSLSLSLRRIFKWLGASHPWRCGEVGTWSPHGGGGWGS